MIYLTVPGLDIKLYEGSVVILARFPQIRWILHNGGYIYQDEEYTGWYFESIPVGDIIPVNDQDLSTLTVIDNKCPCPPRPGPPGPPLPPPSPPDPVVPFRQSMQDDLYAAFITVVSLNKLEAIDTSKIPDGKLVRVNSVDGEVKYFAWDATSQQWVDAGLIQDLSDYLTKDEAAEIYVTQDDLATELAALSTMLQQMINTRCSELSDRIDAINVTIEQMSTDITNIDARITNVEEGKLNVSRLQSIDDTNTVIVRVPTGIADSGIMIGDDVIEEPPQQASDTTLATEKAVATLVTDSVAKFNWKEF